MENNIAEKEEKSTRVHRVQSLMNTLIIFKKLTTNNYYLLFPLIANVSSTIFQGAEHIR